ncbi:hypothetical protein C7M84_002281 [Penaeus vannamei]|uniref:A to I editase domain-containing protein n=1 Tax=Penaeus vannamei TaxID=6689 RepID=A0A3R7MCJ1_PENVA|nr:hypothetical protein C7M84_002281 [Penaeus vannamei]
MAQPPLFPTLTPRLVDPAWFQVDKPVDLAQELKDQEQVYQEQMLAIQQKGSDIVPIGKSATEQKDRKAKGTHRVDLAGLHLAAGKGNMHVVSLGTGSKCIGASQLSGAGDILHDSHAERQCYLFVPNPSKVMPSPHASSGATLQPTKASMKLQQMGGSMA